MANGAVSDILRFERARNARTCRSQHRSEKEETGPKMIMQQYFSLPGQHHKTVLTRHHRVECGKHRKKREHQHTTTSHHQGKNRIIFQNRTRENWTLFSMRNSAAFCASRRLPGVHQSSIFCNLPWGQSCEQTGPDDIWDDEYGCVCVRLPSLGPLQSGNTFFSLLQATYDD